jgi:splicing factor 3B subunit 2
MEKLLKDENVEIEYVDEDPKNKPRFYEAFKNVFDYFVIPKKEKREHEEDDEEEGNVENKEDDVGIDGEPFSNVNGESQHQGVGQKLSKKKRKLLKRMKISELKQKTNKPEVVEAWDVTAQDPITLVYLKSLKNTVQVPVHWSQKRKFLQNKRGVLKPPFKLPTFIEATGISKIRDNTGNDRKTLKDKMRQRMQPKLGKMDIDYQVLHDAFFKYQTKPSNMTIHGDIYYENKEHESKMKIFKPGRISDKLRVALGIPEKSPPPWLINMQRYGPPPAYPNLKIPGINAPLLDPTAEITPNLWLPPVQEEKNILVFDFKTPLSGYEHWGALREAEEEDEGELEEDASISAGEERPEVSNLFSGMDIDDGVPGNSKQKENLQLPSQISTIPHSTSQVFSNDESTTFFKVIEQTTAAAPKTGEIYGSSFGYNIQGKEETQEKLDKQNQKPQEEIKQTTTKSEKDKKKELEKLKKF